MRSGTRRRRVQEALIGALGAAQAGPGWLRPAAIGLAVGVTIGAGVALLLSPRGGAAMRREVAEAVARARARWRREKSNGHAVRTDDESGG